MFNYASEVSVGFLSMYWLNCILLCWILITYLPILMTDYESETVLPRDPKTETLVILQVRNIGDQYYLKPGPGFYCRSYLFFGKNVGQLL